MTDMGNGLKGIVSVSDTGHIVTFDGDAPIRFFLEPGHSFIDHVYLNDRIAVLTFFDALRQEGHARPMIFRLQKQGAVSSNCLLKAQPPAHDGVFELVIVMIEQDTAFPGKEDARKPQQDIPVLAQLAHEIRTPLNAIIGFSDFLLQEAGARFENDIQRDYVALIQKSGQHLLQMANTMLVEAGGAAGVEKPRANVGHIIDDCIGIMRGALYHRQFTGDFKQAALCRVAVGEVEMRRIVINLLSNAVKYTCDGGMIALQVALAGDGRLVLAIKDNGIGISRRQLALIGAPFHRAGNAVASAAEGSGLGLALVYRIVASCGGEVKIKSRQGKGTLVRVFLPLADEAGTVLREVSGETQLICLPGIGKQENTEQYGADNGQEEKETRKTA